MAERLTKESAWSGRWPAPAKLNLMLRIVGQREDGYHLLQTVFQFVEFCDWLTFHPVDNGEVSLLKTIPGVAESDDLTVRAAKLLKAETGCSSGVCIEVEKNLPMGGGLGGGSSDAATTLVVLNQLWGLNLPKEKLLTMGLSLGADVPVFIYGHASWGEGVGEKLSEIIVPEQWVVILKPDCHVNTKEIFSAKDLTRNSKSIKMPDFIEGDRRNDCLETVCRFYPIVDEALKDMSEFAVARLTGTGACVFAQFDSYEDASGAYQKLKGKWVSYLAKGVNRSPLFVKLDTANLNLMI
ncbi:4-diphosphocytidyl-2-C-methyl-D-erythritol kinase IspE [Methyloglobulus morosus KoM1]|uniref:4-diphosphocytidyl-2-C-methyl-D-erythritol kinase n=1 Tax=Methyloglobulus morosus KoM1 TaxID=1116472 RepID=V5BZX5_9GAMM|nr:4-(cytidine 5'-diphospho)-2-C-methyl-D-erythritol kinase [Methyloglobulus morosus]ESS71797.1 4-diphosphocytidyl-2-C-methyl-D-erythritol kinase IspE [Methyloglobulus morosus KoM1]